MLIKILVGLLIGALAGWIAGKIMGSKSSFLRNMIIGVLGGVVGGWLGGLIGIGGGWVMSIVLASTMGIGVALSGAAVFIYQGAITLLAGLLKPVLTDRAVLEMSAVGGLLIMGIGLNMIRDRHLPVGDLLPSMFLPLVLVPLMG